MTDRYVVIGNPVAHSLSPRIHALFARAAGHDIVYERLQASAFQEAAEGFFGVAEHRGANVTLPFKVDAFEWIRGRGRASRAATEAGAVNAIASGPKGLTGHNTDGAGLLRDLQENLGVPLARKSVLLVGAGGAVRGVLGPLLRAGPRRVVIANRTAARATALAAGHEGAQALPLNAVGNGYDVVVNGTAAGVEGAVPELPAAAIEGALGYDMFYRLGGDTPFCRWCRAHGAAAVANGLGMLIEQAAESFFLWRGVRPDTSMVAAALTDG